MVAGWLAGLLVVAACTAPQTGVNAPLVSVSTAETGSAGTSRSPVTVPPVSSGSATGTSSPVSSVSTPSPPPIPPVAWTLVPAPAAADVSPIEPISLAVAQGSLQSVTITNPDGVQIPGALSADNASWTTTEVLGYGRTYAVSAVAVDAAGVTATQNYTFSTLAPANKTLATAFPTDGMTVGVGQPIAIFFDEPITDKAGVQQLITVTATPASEGAFYWISDQEVRWRPRNFWLPGTTVDVAVMIYGRDLGDGTFGQADKHFSFTIGRSTIATVDDSTHTMTITIDGEVVKEMPVSLGRNKYPTYNGIHVVAEKYGSKIMDSSTWGLEGVGAYRTEVGYATRISSSGEFVHAAPWSVDSQGRANVSHGCINVSTANAIWFYENFGYGDIVDIRGTVGPTLQVWDGYGDWTLPWETYALGSGQ